ncbi:YciI family protein [Microbulbifer sp. CAU 1566]|uniref:YciI family protein n=1 Tax=Microbulbifer sp. CAU 1566 TaxID=2933269 RepID=UPI002004B930|nr:YciI family protein [Microbulbifer sp. CAU 1566]MCK7596487.1 YciI family protein [Microbulbifer sp. CAU 1566]
MKNFLAIYLGTPDSMKKWENLSETEQQQRMKEGMAAWTGWMEQHKDILVVEGGPLGKTKRIDDDGIVDTRNDMTGYVIVKAESHEAAAKLFEGHPSFSIFPGDGVEVMECMPIPTL